MKTYLFIIPSITNYFTFLEDIVYGLVSKGEKVYLASSRKHNSEIDCYDREFHGELLEVDLPRGFAWNKHVKAAKQLGQIVSDIEPDVINVHFSAAMFTTAIAKSNNWPTTIAMLHGLEFPILKGWKKIAIGFAERWAAKKMDLLILLNEKDRDDLQGYIHDDDIHVLSSYGLGCDLKKFDRDSISEETKTRYHRRLGIREDDFVFIFVGRQVEYKDFDKLIRAYLLVYEDHKNLKLILVGAKDHLHSNNLSADEELRMKHCPGIINVGWKENVHEYLTVAHINVFPSEREGMPVNLMESIAMGVPVLTSNSRGCNEVVENGVNGIIMDKNSVEDIRDNMFFLFENPIELKKLVAGAYRTRAKFDRQSFILEMLELFESLPSRLSK